MTADEACALLADVAPRRVCAMCGAVNPPTVRDTIGGDAVDLHDGCSDVVRGRVDLTYGMLRHEDALRALRSVVEMHGQTVPPHGAVVYADDGLPPHIAARLAGVEGVGDAVLVVEYRDPDAPGAGPAEWDSRRAAKRLTAGQDTTWCGIDGTGLVVVHGPQEAHQRPRATPDGGGEPRGDGAPARGLPVAPPGVPPGDS